MTSHTLVGSITFNDGSKGSLQLNLPPLPATPQHQGYGVKTEVTESGQTVLAGTGIGIGIPALTDFGMALTIPDTPRSEHQSIIADAEVPFYKDGELVPTKVVDLPEYQQRVIIEHLELDQRVFKLGQFMGCEVWKTLDPAEQDDMHAQYNAMQAYLRALQRIINRFTGMDQVANEG